MNKLQEHVNKKLEDPVYKKTMGMCIAKGCKEYTHRNHDYCYDHWKETQPAYAEDITAAVKQWLKYKGYTKIVTERSTSGWNYSSRFDVMAAKIIDDKNFEIIGIEVKSDHDSYNRLSRQLPDYIDIFDKVYLCIDNKEKVKHPVIGILRFENGHITVEKDCHFMNRTYDILSSPEMEAMLKLCGLHVKDSSAISEALNVVPNIRRKLVFNRFFTDMDWINKEMKDAMMFSEKEIEFLIRIGVHTNIKYLLTKVRTLKTVLSGMEKICKSVEKLDRDEKQKIIDLREFDKK